MSIARLVLGARAFSTLSGMKFLQAIGRGVAMNRLFDGRRSLKDQQLGSRPGQS